MIRSEWRVGFSRVAFKIWVPALVIAGGLLMVAPASATGTLDQSQGATSGLEVTAAGSEWVAQTFTAGVTGNLDQVDLFLFRVGSPGDLTVQIQAVSADVPSGSVLATTTVTQARVGDSFTWVSVPLSSPARVTAGMQYAIVLSAPNAAGFPGDLYALNFVFGNPYSAGRVVISSTSGSSWGDFAVVFDDGDAAFKTYVTPVPTAITQCLNEAWRSFPQFKNQGDCVSFAATKGRNSPG